MHLQLASYTTTPGNDITDSGLGLLPELTVKITSCDMLPHKPDKDNYLAETSFQVILGNVDSPQQHVSPEPMA